MPVFTHLSFSQLDENLQEAVRASARSGASQITGAWPIDARDVFLNRLDLPKALERSKAFVDEVQPIAFAYFDDAYRAYYEDELSFAFYLALADCELAILEGRTDLTGRRDYLLHIGGLLAQLRNREQFTELGINNYLGMRSINERLNAAIKKTTIDDISKAVEYPASLNDGRLYLVWAAEMLTDICLAWAVLQPYLSFELVNLVLDYISLGTGFMGWSLYFLRGGVNTLFLFDVSAEIKALNLTNDEAWAYFWGKWDERKIQILNDAVWGLVNFLCFYFLFGGGMLGYYGDLLNGVLFMVDVALSLWDYAEKQAKFTRIKDEYIAAIAATPPELKWRINDLIRDKKTVERDWEYECSQLQLDALYSATVLLAVAILCCFFVPPGVLLASTASNLILAGSIMCFGLGIVYEALTSRLQLLKVTEDLGDIQLEKDACAFGVKELDQAGQNDESKVEFSKLLHLEEKEAYQKQLSQYHHANMWCNLIVDTLFPVLLIEAFVFMPMAIGISAFVVGVVLMFAAYCYVAELAPEDVRDDSVSLTMLTKFSGLFFNRAENNNDEVKDFPKTDYDTFCAAA
jgi:hypothetical protein